MNDAVTVIEGSSAGKCTKAECTLIAARDVDGSEKKLLWIKRLKGGIAVSARIFDRNGNLIAKLDDGRPERDAASLWQTPHRPSTSSLQIMSNRDEPILRIDYLNAKTMKIEGTFFAPSKEGQQSSRVAIITKSVITLMPGYNVISGMCAEDSGSSDIFF